MIMHTKTINNITGNCSVFAFLNTDVVHACVGDAVDLMVNVLDSGSGGLGLSADRGHGVVFLGKTLYSRSNPLHPGVNWYWQTVSVT